MRSGLRICALTLSLASSACGQPAPPLVAQRVPSLDADDLAVMRGLVDYVAWSHSVDEIRHSQATGAPVLGIAPHMVVVDTTIPVCQTDAVAFGTPPGGCLGTDWMRYVVRVMPAGSARTGTIAFEARNVRRLPFQGRLGPDVSYVSATLPDSLPPRVLLADHPPGSTLITLSAPIFIAPRSAVLAYSSRVGQSAAARLERWADGHWSVVAIDGIETVE